MAEFYSYRKFINTFGKKKQQQSRTYNTIRKAKTKKFTPPLKHNPSGHPT